MRNHSSQGTYRDPHTLLLLAAGEGDVQAFASFHAVMHPIVRDFIVSRDGRFNCHEVDDMVQEVFLRTWAGARRFQGQSSGKTYLLGVAMNVLREAWLRRAKLPAVWSIDLASLEDGSHPSLRVEPRPVDTQELMEEIVHAKAKLTGGQLEALELVHFRGMTMKEAARASGCNPNQFRNRLWRARERLRQLLQHVMRTATS